MSRGKFFTVEEADSALAVLGQRLERIREARHELIRSTQKIEERVAIDGGGVEGKSWFEANATLRAEVEAIAAEGIILRDPETGLVDFPSEREGQPVFLCWRLGEPSVRFWHPVDTGIASRKPL